MDFYFCFIYVCEARVFSVGGIIAEALFPGRTSGIPGAPSFFLHHRHHSHHRHRRPSDTLPLKGIFLLPEELLLVITGILMIHQVIWLLDLGLHGRNMLRLLDPIPITQHLPIYCGYSHRNLPSNKSNHWLDYYTCKFQIRILQSLILASLDRIQSNPLAKKSTTFGPVSFKSSYKSK